MSGPGRYPGSPLAGMTPRRAWYGVAVLTALVVALTSGVTLVSRLTAESRSSSRAYADVSALDLHLSGGTVTVSRGPVRRATVSEHMHWTTTRPTVDVQQTGSTLHVTVQCDDFGLFSKLGCRVDVRIQLPPLASVRSVAGSGRTIVQGLAGPLDLTSASGEIDLQNVTGAVQVHTASGPVEATGVRSSRVFGQSGSGPLHLAFALPPKDVQLQSSSGPIEVELPRGSHYRVSGDSSGPRDVVDGLAQDSAPGSVAVNTGSGPVDIGYAAR